MNQTKRLLIVNADDYGRTPEICRGIIECSRAGLVRSTTVMANYVSESDLTALLESGLLSAGLHFNLTSGKPIAPWNHQLLDADGRFIVKPPEDLPSEFIEAELEAQWDFLISRGLKPTHIDSHHHIHAQAAVLAVVAAFALKRGIPVRSCDEATGMKLRRFGIPTTERFSGRFFGAQHITTDAFISILDETECASLEIMCHPGYCSPTLEEESAYVVERDAEFAVLTNRALIERVLQRGWTPGAYNEL